MRNRRGGGWSNTRTYWKPTTSITMQKLAYMGRLEWMVTEHPGGAQTWLHDIRIVKGPDAAMAPTFDEYVALQRSKGITVNVL